MKTVTLFQAKDGSNHTTPKACKDHEASLLLAPAAHAFVGSAAVAASKHVSDNERGSQVIYMEDLAGFIVDNADQLRKLLTEPLIVRRPRKPKVAAKEIVAEVNAELDELLEDIAAKDDAKSAPEVTKADVAVDVDAEQLEAMIAELA